MVNSVALSQEVNLDSIRYKLRGHVRITLPEGFAEKTVLGDFTQESLRRRNVMRWSDFSGGIGLKVVSPQDGAINLRRVWYSDCHLFQRGQVTLPKGETAMTGGPSGTHQALAFFNGQFYLVGASGDVFRTSASSDNLTDTTHDLTNTTVDWVAGRLNGSDFLIFGQDGSGYEFSTDGASYTTGGREGHFLVIWDDRLWGFDVDDHKLWFTLSPSATVGDHTDDAVLSAELGTALGMFTGPDAAGEDIIYVLTRDALWAHDAGNARFVKTRFQQIIPTKRDTTELPRDYHVRPAVWNTAIYIPSGLNVWEYSPVAGTIRSIGPDDDFHNLPSTDVFGGPIRTLVSSDDAIFALNDTSQSEAGSSATSNVLEWNGRAWQSFYSTTVTPGSGNVTHAAVVGVQEKTTTHEYRLWAATAGTDELFWDLPLWSKDPKGFSKYVYGVNQDSFARLTLPWIDAGTDSESFALRVKVDAVDLDASNEIEVQYLSTFDPNASMLTTYTALATGASALDTDGISILTFPDNGTSEEGLLFRWILLQLRLSRGTSTQSPVLNSLEFEWYRKPTFKLGFEFQIDMREVYGPRTPTDQFFALMNSVKNASGLLELTWKDTSVTQSGITRTYYVAITSLEMLEEGTGTKDGGIMLVRAEEV